MKGGRDGEQGDVGQGRSEAKQERWKEMERFHSIHGDKCANHSNGWGTAERCNEENDELMVLTRVGVACFHFLLASNDFPRKMATCMLHMHAARHAFPLKNKVSAHAFGSACLMLRSGVNAEG